jgi:hypothetical protein
VREVEIVAVTPVSLAVPPEALYYFEFKAVAEMGPRTTKPSL